MFKYDKKKNENINVCLACDNNYAKYMGVTIASLIKHFDNNKQYTLHIYAMEFGFQQENINKLNLIVDNIPNIHLHHISISKEEEQRIEKV